MKSAHQHVLACRRSAVSGLCCGAAVALWGGGALHCNHHHRPHAQRWPHHARAHMHSPSSATQHSLPCAGSWRTTSAAGGVRAATSTHARPAQPQQRRSATGTRGTPAGRRPPSRRPPFRATKTNFGPMYSTDFLGPNLTDPSLVSDAVGNHSRETVRRVGCGRAMAENARRQTGL